MVRDVPFDSDHRTHRHIVNDPFASTLGHQQCPTHFDGSMNRITSSADSSSSSSSVRERKVVLIWLPPSPPPEMGDPRRSERLKSHAALPKDDVPGLERSLPSAASSWDDVDLQLLDVYFNALEGRECLGVLSNDPEWDPSERKKIERYAEEIAKIGPGLTTMSSDDIYEHSHRFATFFQYLQKVIRQNVPNETLAANSPLEESPSSAEELSTDTSSADLPSLVPLTTSVVHDFVVPGSNSPSRKRPSSPTISNSATPLKVRPMSSEVNLKTPDRPPPTSNPDFTGDASETCPEDNSREMMKLFVETTLSLFEREIASVKWIKHIPGYRLDTDGSEVMQFSFKKNQMIKPVNDGAIVLRQQSRVWCYQDKGRNLRTIVSIEAKSKNRKDEWMLGGQIFCEMLAQVCHSTVYSLPDHEYVEAFVIHVRHTKARLFYCKFPVPYLRNIAKHGRDYVSKVNNHQGVKLEHTKPYELRDASRRREFFWHLCRLITYLTSGKSRVPFLWNHPANPLHTKYWEEFNVDGQGMPDFWNEPKSNHGKCEYPTVLEDSSTEDSGSRPSSSDRWSNKSYDPRTVRD